MASSIIPLPVASNKNVTETQTSCRGRLEQDFWAIRIRHVRPRQDLSPSRDARPGLAAEVFEVGRLENSPGVLPEGAGINPWRLYPVCHGARKGLSTRPIQRDLFAFANNALSLELCGGWRGLLPVAITLRVVA